MKKLSIIMPCFNCEEIISDTIIKLFNLVKDANLDSYEFILINDGSSDNTAEIISNFQSENIKFIDNKKNLGKSASILIGLNNSKFDNVILIDCDLPYIDKILEVLRNLDQFDFVYINRKSKESKIINNTKGFYIFSRFVIGHTISILLNLFFFNFKVGDTQAGLKAFKKPINLNEYKFISKKFFFDAELMLIFYRSGIKLFDIPVVYEIDKKSSINIFSIKNIKIILELLQVIIFYSLNKTNKIKLKD
ncbi:glycosyltransferase family 2 protein [Alphaproteobacteria bacterium]|nr:glycosyltransferase family 2 protein [Alphaproteobacteria bacterium]